jgi:hypothetical protein
LSQTLSQEKAFPACTRTKLQYSYMMKRPSQLPVLLLQPFRWSTWPPQQARRDRTCIQNINVLSICSTSANVMFIFKYVHMGNQSCTRSHYKNCLFFVIFLGVHQRSGVPPTIRHALGGSALWIEIPFSSVPVFNRNQYSCTLLHVVAGLLIKKATCNGMYSKNHAASRYHWIFGDSCTPKIPWLLESVGFSESHRLKIPWLPQH